MSTEGCSAERHRQHEQAAGDDEIAQARERGEVEALVDGVQAVVLEAEVLDRREHDRGVEPRRRILERVQAARGVREVLVAQRIRAGIDDRDPMTERRQGEPDRALAAAHVEDARALGQAREGAEHERLLDDALVDEQHLDAPRVVVHGHGRVEPHARLRGVAVGAGRPVEVSGARGVELRERAAWLRHVTPAQAREHVAAHAVEVVEPVVNGRAPQAVAAQARVDLVHGHVDARVEHAPQRPADHALDARGDAHVTESRRRAKAGSLATRLIAASIWRASPTAWPSPRARDQGHVRAGARPGATRRLRPPAPGATRRLRPPAPGATRRLRWRAPGATRRLRAAARLRTVSERTWLEEEPPSDGLYVIWTRTRMRAATPPQSGARSRVRLDDHAHGARRRRSTPTCARTPSAGSRRSAAGTGPAARRHPPSRRP